MNNLADPGERMLAGCFMAIVVLAFLIAGLDWLSSVPVLIGPGVVKQTVYVPATHSHGTGITLDKNSSTVMTSSSTYEEYTAVVTVNGHTLSVPTTADDWGQLCIGSSVDVYEYRGRLFGGGFRRFLRLKGKRLNHEGTKEDETH